MSDYKVRGGLLRQLGMPWDMYSIFFDEHHLSAHEWSEVEDGWYRVDGNITDMQEVEENG